MKESDITVLTILVLAMFILYVGVILHSSDCHNRQITGLEKVIEILEANE